MWYAGLDVHKEFVQACIVNKRGKTILEQRFETTKRGLQQLRSQLQSTRCVIESSTSCFQVYDALKDAEIQVRVAHPFRLKAIASAKIKTDKVDARTLAQLERADLIPEAHIPERLTREERELVKQHVALVQQRTAEINRVKALLLKHGLTLPYSNLKTEKALQRLEVAGEENLHLLLQGSAAHIRFLNEQIKRIDGCIEERAQQNADAVMLKTIPGVGWFSALLLAAYIDGAERFPSAEHLSSYAGLAPSIYQSGAVLRNGALSKQGNKLMRWALVQAAWKAVRESKRFRKVFLRTSRKRGKHKAIVAVARKMLTCAYFMLSRRQAFDENA